MFETRDYNYIGTAWLQAGVDMLFVCVRVMIERPTFDPFHTMDLRHSLQQAATASAPGDVTRRSSQTMTWREVVTSLYPAALTRTYCVPPVHFSRVPYIRETVPGTDQPAFVLGRPSGPPKSKPTLLDRSASFQTQSLPPCSAQTILGDADTKSKSAAASGGASSRDFVVVAHSSQLSSSGAAADREVPTAPQGQSSCLNPPRVVSARTVHTGRLASRSGCSVPASASQTVKPRGGVRSVRHVPAKTDQLAGSAQSVPSVSTKPQHDQLAFSAQSVPSVSTKPNHSQQIRSALAIDTVNPTKTSQPAGTDQSVDRVPTKTSQPAGTAQSVDTVSTKITRSAVIAQSFDKVSPANTGTDLSVDNVPTKTTQPAVTDLSVDNVPTKTTQSASTAQTSQPDSTAQTTQPDSTAQTSQPNSTGQTTQPAGTAQTTQPDSTAQTTQPDSAAQTTQPDSTAQTIDTVSTTSSEPASTTHHVYYVPASRKSDPSSDDYDPLLPSSPVSPTGQEPEITHYRLWHQESDAQAEPDLRFQSSDVQEDIAQTFLLTNLLKLAEERHEVMFIVSQLDFGSYLNEPSYAAAVSCLPKPTDLSEEYRRGDFDVLVIHRHYGVLVGEVKSVGIASHTGVRITREQEDAAVVKRLQKAVKQLDKSESVVRHLLSDMSSALTVRKTIFLPYLSSSQLQRVLDEHPKVEQAMSQSLAAAESGVDVTELSVCSDHLSDPDTFWHVTPAVLSQLAAWWQRRMASVVDQHMSDQLYLDIVARFVGPATTVDVHCNVPPRVEVRTEGEAASELGRRLARLVLTPQQLGLMKWAPSRVCITGPPGTGKTLMLVLIGIRWLRQDRDVHVVSTFPGSLAASRVIRHQLKMTVAVSSSSSEYTPPQSSSAAVPAGTVRFHAYDLYDSEADVDRALADLLEAVRGGRLCVLVDEAKFTNSPTSAKLQRLVGELAKQVPQLYLWAACLGNTDIPPELQSEVKMTLPLRCAPVVLREIRAGIRRFNIHDYTDEGVAAPGDGMSVVRLLHPGDAHTVRWPVDCFQCGKDMAAELRRLGVGVKGNDLPHGPPALSYNDVFIVTRSSHLRDDVRDDDDGRVTSSASGVVLGLRAAGLPVCVLEDAQHPTSRWERKVANTAVARTDRITVAYHGAVSGLERKVVVLLRGRRQGHDDGDDDKKVESREMLYGVSRCTTQLIDVCMRA